MPRERKIYISVINIAMHGPHSPEAYIELMQNLYKMQQYADIGASTNLLIGSMSLINREKPEEGLTGEILRFTNIDQFKPWLNIKSLGEATKEERESINIPDGLKPNLTRFNYVFFPIAHRFYIQTASKKRTLSVKHISKLLHNLTKNHTPSVSVTIEPDKNAIEEILAIKSLRKLHITLRRPNPDDHYEAEKRLLKKLEDQGACQVDTILHGNNHSPLTPDEDTRTLAQVAASNGSVVGEGKDAAGNSIKKSSIDKPLSEFATFNENRETEQQAFLNKATEIHNKFKI